MATPQSTLYEHCQPFGLLIHPLWQILPNADWLHPRRCTPGVRGYSCSVSHAIGNGEVYVSEPRLRIG